MTRCALFVSYLLISTGLWAKEIQQEIKQVDVFVTDATPIAAGQRAVSLESAGSLRLYNLDDQQRINRRLVVGIDPKTDPNEIARIVRVRASALTDADRQALARAALGQAMAKGMKVTRVPAVVINQEHIFYGAKSIEQAMETYERQPPKSAVQNPQAPQAPGAQ
jgi:integrating conjugative element protein (TIGR03757 family)